MSTTKIYFNQFLENAFDNGQYATDDVIAFVLPLFEEVLSFHEASLVAPFHREDALLITEGHLDIDETFSVAETKAPEKLAALFAPVKSAQFDILGKREIKTDVEIGNIEVKDLQVHFDTNQTLLYPAYIRGYNCFETLLGHHDVQTDIFCLGLVLGSMAMSVNLYDEEDVNLFAQYRNNPVQFNQRIHPTISSLITEMTELDRKKRTNNLYDVINRLHHYREYDPEKQTDLSKVAGWVNKEIKERRQFILNKLRNRLFDTSRRNRLLYYKPNMRFVNLTISSVPMVLHYQSIRTDLLFTWNSDISSRVTAMKEIVLNKYLRFEDHPYLSAYLDKIRLESQRNINEYGFSQLKMVITFLNWHNLKENSAERIQSPLLLIPVEVKKIKRIKEDHYSMKVLDNVAEVNPVLANQLRELYGIRLPDFVDLDEMSLEQFYHILKEQIDAANQGIQLYYADKPKIKLVHSVAKQTVNNYRRRIRKASGHFDSYKNISYSYQHEHYKPLGLEIFRQRIEPKHSFLEFLVNEDIQLNTQQLTGNNTKERELFEMAESEHNPYSWDFDLCNIVLGNFNYKKMSLVRDYNHVIDNNLPHKIFDALFSNEPKQIQEHLFDLNKPGDWHHVITADPTQTQAILRGRTGDSYIIQGPPGTGKSQTITNLIADFVARGKNILFVCEKRAALDVVFHRLRQNGLDELCCYIHDSQSDKREFIKNLKNTYEDFSKNKMDWNGIVVRRNALLMQLNEQIELLQQFHLGNISQHSGAGMPVRKLIDRIIELKNDIIPLNPLQQELLPGYEQWISFGDTLKALSQLLEEEGGDASFATHPLSKLNDRLLLSEQPLNLLENLLQQSAKQLVEIKAIIADNNISTEHSSFIQQIKNLVQDAVLLLPLAEHDNLNLVNTGNKEAKKLDADIKKHAGLEKKYKQQQDLNVFWKNKMSEQDVSTALRIAEKNEGAFFGFLNGDWRKLKKQLQKSYDFSRHQVKPKYVQLLQQLQQEYHFGRELMTNKNNLQQLYKVDNIEITYIAIETLRGKREDKELDYLLQHPQGNELVKSLCRLKDPLHKLEQHLNLCLDNYSEKTIDAILDELETIALNRDALKDLLPALRDFAGLPVGLKNTVRTIALTPVQTEAAMADKTLSDIYRHNKAFAAIDLYSIEKAVEKIKACYQQLLRLNADLIRSTIRKKFLANIELSNTAVSQLNSDQKQFKKTYNEGRKILENEFGKSMRYKSIRELSAKESGLVLKDIKPVWLMSPLSVSDSLPVDSDFFDVVIFDEASQITLEEGIPALFRSLQTIIVGDERQMPPTNFFTSKTEDPDDIDIFENDESEDALLSADADSLLVQGSRKLGSTMLSWHYRSHFETLISYSNHAFYDAGLLTIPDRTIHTNGKKEIIVTQPEDALQFADMLYDRSISFHYYAGSIYEKRNNLDEARYIAHLVSALLKKGVKESIGIVAFSQEQQQTIEDALTALAQQDKIFEPLLEAAYSRMEEDQFVGLIIKNLENIQGDERDIIIMSVCYGFDAKKKMIMNFGPVNKKGGEKRLNVIFSRAKKHMAIISSIRHYNITNDYNEGAGYFKRFLQYAESVSNGSMQTARTILDSLVANKKDNISTTSSNIVLKEIKEQLQKKGYQVTEQVGQSDFKCSLAIKLQENDEAYAAAILLDDDAHYNNSNLVEQYYQRPAILQSFGWKSIHVFSKDWLARPEKVMDHIIKRMKEVPEPELVLEAVPDHQLLPGILATPGEEASLIIETTPEKSGTVLPGFEDLAFERYTFTEEGSNKFWEAATQNEKLVVRFGKIKTRGQVQVKTFADAEKATAEKQKLVAEKIKKGYVKS